MTKDDIDYIKKVAKDIKNKELQKNIQQKLDSIYNDNAILK
jgi:hypothetical protein